MPIASSRWGRKHGVDRLRVKARCSGRVLHLGDALLAGTIMAQDPVIATRNTSDFYGLGLGVINPWQTQ